MVILLKAIVVIVTNHYSRIVFLHDKRYLHTYEHGSKAI